MAVATVAWRARVRRAKGTLSPILAERARIARAIHDTLLQDLVGVLLRLDEVSNTLDERAEPARDSLRRVRQQVETCIREARESIRDLRSPVLQREDLGAALREAGERITAGRVVSFDFRIGGRPKRGAQTVEEHLLRIGQEAISNAVRHGTPSIVSVALIYDEKSVRLRVEDDGIGFDPKAVTPPGDGHWGVITMRERAEQIGGTFEITSRAGKGSRVEVNAPL